MSIKLTNTSRYLAREGDTDWWRWTAHLECSPPNLLDGIDYVEYHLHPTFRKPVVRVKKRAGGFPLEQTGWGIFELKAKVVFKDQRREPLLLSHYLEFEGAEPDA